MVSANGGAVLRGVVLCSQHLRIFGFCGEVHSRVVAAQKQLLLPRDGRGSCAEGGNGGDFFSTVLMNYCTQAQFLASRRARSRRRAVRASGSVRRRLFFRRVVPVAAVVICAVYLINSVPELRRVFYGETATT